MPEKILGIDIGSRFLKAVLATRSMRAGFRVEMAEAIDIAGAGGVSEALAVVGGKVDFRQVRINLSLPADALSFHNVKLPFREEKKISQTIAFELENMLPHGIDDYLLDYSIIKQSNHSETLAALVSRTVVLEKRALFGDNQHSIGTTGVDALSVASLLIADKALAGSDLLLDVGARKTVAVFMERGKIVQVRSYAFGGDFAAPEKKEGGPVPGASDLHNQGGPSDEVAMAVDSCGRFFRELANTLEYLKWGGSMGDGLARIMLTGGGSLRRDFREELARYFSLPLETVDVSILGGVQLSEGIGNNWQPALMNQALALAIDRYKKGMGFDFPLRELETQIRRVEMGRALKWGLSVFAGAAILLGADSYLDYRYSRLRLEKLQKEINTVFKGAAPEITRIVDPVQQFKVKIAEAKKISAGLGGRDSGATVLDILKDISTLAPLTTGFLITSFNLDDDRLVIKGTTKNFDAVDILKKEFAKSKYLNSIQIGSTGMLKQSDKVEFDLRITVQR